MFFHTFGALLRPNIYIYIYTRNFALASLAQVSSALRASYSFESWDILVSHPDASEVVFLICDLSAKNIFQIAIHARCSEKPLVSCFKVGTRLTSDENASPSTNELAGHRSRWAKMRPSGAKMGQKEATMAPR